jgi:FKBP-type peptidyl-prolyl cis-trans isomerase
MITPAYFVAVSEHRPENHPGRFEADLAPTIPHLKKVLQIRVYGKTYCSVGSEFDIRANRGRLNLMNRLCLFTLAFISTLSIASAQDPHPPSETEEAELIAPEDVKAAPADAQTTESGLASKVIREGTGKEKPVAADTVQVSYSGWTTDGKLFDSSMKSGAPACFPLNRVIPGWTEGVQLMVEGEKRRFWIPAKLAFGDNPSGGRPAGTLVFDVELLSILSVPKVPEDLTAVPETAEKTASGLASRVLKEGRGDVHPKSTDTVDVHHSGWTLDGKMLFSSVSRSVSLDGRMPGWTEGLQLMVVGEKRRLWIPAKLAFGDNPSDGRPAGMIVLDIELLDIK